MTQQNHNKKPTNTKLSNDSVPTIKNLIFLIIVVGLLALSAALTYKISIMRTVPNATRPQVNQTVISAEKTYSVKLNNAYVDTSLAQRFHLPSTQKVVIYDLSITNNNSNKLYITPALQLFLRDNEGDYYQLLADVVKDPLKPGIIEKGQTSQGEVAFVVMNRKMPLWLYIDTGWENRGPVVFDGTI